jgi:hypothetical protein
MLLCIESIEETSLCMQAWTSIKPGERKERESIPMLIGGQPHVSTQHKNHGRAFSGKEVPRNSKENEKEVVLHCTTRGQQTV